MQYNTLRWLALNVKCCYVQMRAAYWRDRLSQKNYHIDISVYRAALQNSDNIERRDL